MRARWFDWAHVEPAASAATSKAKGRVERNILHTVAQRDFDAPGSASKVQHGAHHWLGSEHDHEGLVLAGDRCEKVMARLIVRVPVKDVQCDEIWSFIQKKETALEPERQADSNVLRRLGMKR